MRHLAILCSAAILVGCAKTESKPDSTAAAAAAATPAAPATPALKLADLAGKWTMTGKTMTGDTTIAAYVLVATPDTTGWTITFTNPSRPAMPAHVAVGGDSVTIDAGPYESVVRKGVKVTTHTVQRLQGGHLVGTTVAHYAVKTADSVRTLRADGTRAP